MCSIYFLGFGLGVVLFFLPDKVGRKGTMNIVLPLYAVSTAIGTFSPNLFLKSLSYFMNGFLHISITCTFTHMYELVE